MVENSKVHKGRVLNPIWLHIYNCFGPGTEIGWYLFPLLFCGCGRWRSVTTSFSFPFLFFLHHGACYFWLVVSVALLVICCCFFLPSSFALCYMLYFTHIFIFPCGEAAMLWLRHVLLRWSPWKSTSKISNGGIYIPLSRKDETEDALLFIFIHRINNVTIIQVDLRQHKITP